MTDIHFSESHARPLRILWVVSKFQQKWIGGIGRIVEEGSAALIARGHEVHVAGVAPSGQPGVLRAAIGHPWPARSWKFQQLGPLLDLICEIEPDVVHFHSAAPHGAVILPLLMWRRSRRSPAVILTPYSAPRAEHPTVLTRLSVRYADGVIVSSRWLGEKFRAYVRDPHALQAIFAGVDFPSDRTAAAVRQPFVFSISSLSFRKGLDVLINAFALIAEEFPEWTLRIAGMGTQEAELRALAASKSCASRIEFLGRQMGEAKETLLCTASIGVVSSRHDNLPGTLMEFQAYGVPAVASSVGGIPDLAEGGKLSKLVTPESVEELAGALKDLIANPSLRNQLAQEARRASANRSWANYAAAHEAFYCRALAHLRGG